MQAAADVKGLGGIVTSSRERASVFVVENPCSPGDRIQWLSIIFGCLVASPDVQEGPFIQYAPAIHIPLKLDWTDEFQKKYGWL